MATYTPPPYFPQSSLSPPDEKRYLKFKVIVTTLVVVLLLFVVGIGIGIWFLLNWAL